MKKKVYNFVDAQEMHRLHPDTFEVPTDAELAGIKRGSSVKVCHNSESFWVKVRRVDGSCITGVVDNVLIRKQPFKLGDMVSFETRHVYSIWDRV